MFKEMQFQPLICAKSVDHPVLATCNEQDVFISWIDTLENRVYVQNTQSGQKVTLDAPGVWGAPVLTCSPLKNKLILGWHQAGMVIWHFMTPNLELEAINQFTGMDPAACFDSNGIARLFWSDKGRIVSWQEKNGITEIGGSKGYRITVAACLEGKAVIVWDDIAGSDRGIYTVMVDSGNHLETQPVLLTKDLGYNTAPHAVSDAEGRIFIAWENCRFNISGRGFYHLGSEAMLKIQDNEKLGGYGYHIERVVLGAVKSEDTWRWLGGQIGEAPIPLALDGVKPALVIENKNRVWLTYEAYNSNLKRDEIYWSTWMKQISAGINSQAYELLHGAGYYSRRTAVTCANSRIWMAWKQAKDDSDKESVIIVGSVETNPVGHENMFKPIARPVRSAEADFKNQSDTNPSQSTDDRYRILFGDLHMHSELSRCSRSNNGDLREKFEVTRDVQGLQFAAITDHTNSISQYDWDLLQKTVRLYHEPEKFITFLACEFVSSNPNANSHFHRQVIHLDDSNELLFHDHEPEICHNADIWKRIGDKKIFTILHQPADSIMKNVYQEHDPHYQPLVEIYQVRGSYEKWQGFHWVFEHRNRYVADSKDVKSKMRSLVKPEDFMEKRYMIQEALAEGLIFGFCGGGEHEGSGITGVYAEEFTREGIYEALMSRRCYATTGAKIKLEVTIDGHYMGEMIHMETAPHLNIHVKGTAPVKQVTIVKDNVDVWSYVPDYQETELEFTWKDSGDLYAPDWKALHHAYYVRIQQVDSHMAWSSPIYVFDTTSS